MSTVTIAMTRGSGRWGSTAVILPDGGRSPERQTAPRLSQHKPAGRQERDQDGGGEHQGGVDVEPHRRERALRQSPDLLGLAPDGTQEKIVNDGECDDMRTAITAPVVAPVSAGPNGGRVRRAATRPAANCSAKIDHIPDERRVVAARPDDVAVDDVDGQRERAGQPEQQAEAHRIGALTDGSARRRRPARTSSREARLKVLQQRRELVAVAVAPPSRVQPQQPFHANACSRRNPCRVTAWACWRYWRRADTPGAVMR